VRGAVHDKAGRGRFAFVLLIREVFQQLDQLLNRPEALAVIAAQRAGHGDIHD